MYLQESNHNSQNYESVKIEEVYGAKLDSQGILTSKLHKLAK